MEEKLFPHANSLDSRKELEEEFGFGSTKAFKVLKALCDAGLLIQQKYGNRTVYVPLK